MTDGPHPRPTPDFTKRPPLQTHKLSQQAADYRFMLPIEHRLTVSMTSLTIMHVYADLLSVQARKLYAG